MEARRPTPGDAAATAAATSSGSLVEIVCRHTRGVEIARGGGEQGTGGKSGTINCSFYIPCLRFGVNRRPRFLAVSLFTPRRLRSNASVVPLAVVSRFADQFSTSPSPSPSCYRHFISFYLGESDVVIDTGKVKGKRFRIGARLHLSRCIILCFSIHLSLFNYIWNSLSLIFA